jgi:hypothetical protein
MRCSAPMRGVNGSLAIAAGDLFPSPNYMRWRSQFARRGKLGLAGAYLWRAMWVLGQGTHRDPHRVAHPASEGRGLELGRMWAATSTQR